MEPTTVITGEPALSFTYDPKRSLYEQFAKASGNREGEGELEAAVRRADEAADGSESDKQSQSSSDAEHSASDAEDSQGEADGVKKPGVKKPRNANTHSPFFSMFSLFEGSPTYKQRRKKVPKARKSPPAPDHHPYGSTMSMDADPTSSYGLYSQQQQQQPFQEPHLDRFGRETVRLSAEDMFRAQARGDFASSNPDVLASQKERQRRALEALELSQGQGQAQQPYMSTGLSGPGIVPVPSPNTNGSAAFAQYEYEQQARSQQQPVPMPGRPHLEQRHTYPIPEYVAQTQTQMPPHSHQHPHSHPMPVRSGTDPYGAVVSMPQQPLAAGWAGAEGVLVNGVAGALPRTKAFVCPLFSCGRMFKRMEHLKRHLRTHTLERPFQCEQCKKRFSRSDNLAQHVRTHDRRAVAAASGLVAEMDQMQEAGRESVEADELELLEGEADVEDSELDYLSGSRGITSVQMCEVEVQGQVHEVQGDEEGLVTTTGAIAHPAAVPVPVPIAETQEMYFDQIQQPQPNLHAQYEAVLRASPEASPYMTATTSSNGSPDARWASIPSQPQQPSPTSAFAVQQQPQPQPSQQQQQRLDASYHTLGDFVTSISAPSHKLTFDHAALYPPELALNGPGPIRRHRSATPSIAKFGPGVAGVGETIRRPYSAALSEHGQRSYHPYAVPGHHHSAQSSPMAYTVPLNANGYEGVTPPTSRHGHQTHSRSSSSGGLQEQMRQMLSLEQVQQQQQVVEADMAYGSSQVQVQPQAQPQYQVYRTDSPMQYSTGVPGETYEMDVASQHHQQEMVQGMYVVQDAQYAQAQQQAYFAHPHAHPHHSL